MTSFNFLVAFISLLLAGCLGNQGFEGYRYNPFQYPYPEYYLKAESIPISDMKIKPENTMAQISFFDLSSSVPAELLNVEPTAVSDNKIVYKADDKILIIHREKDTLLGCADEEERKMNNDFCSAFASTREFYDKLYTFTPDDLKRNDNKLTGNKWIVHRKGFVFENVENINRYLGKDFIAYESNYKTGGKLTKDIVLILDKTYPYYFTFSTNICGDQFFKDMLESLQY